MYISDYADATAITARDKASTNAAFNKTPHEAKKRVLEINGK